MIKTTLSIALVGVLYACSNEETKDPQFCECMKIGEKLSDYSSDLLERTPTEEDEKKMQELREKSTRECGKYYRMSGEEMLKRKKLCE